jgi:hypothetical protein
MTEQTTYVLNARVPLTGHMVPLYESPLVVSGPIQPVTERPAFTLVSLEGARAGRVRPSALQWELHTARDVEPLEEPEEERLREMSRRGEIVLGLGGMPEGFWEMPRPEDPEGAMRQILIEGRE